MNPEIQQDIAQEQRRDRCAICGDILDFPGDYICIDCKAGDYR